MMVAVDQVTTGSLQLCASVSPILCLNDCDSLKSGAEDRTVSEHAHTQMSLFLHRGSAVVFIDPDERPS